MILAATLGVQELLIVLVIVLLLFGSTKLPKLARSLGQAQQEFKRGTSEEARDDDGLPSSEGDSRPAN